MNAVDGHAAELEGGLRLTRDLYVHWVALRSISHHTLACYETCHGFIGLVD